MLVFAVEILLVKYWVLRNVKQVAAVSRLFKWAHNPKHLTNDLLVCIQISKAKSEMFENAMSGWKLFLPFYIYVSLKGQTRAASERTTSEEKNTKIATGNTTLFVSETKIYFAAQFEWRRSKKSLGHSLIYICTQIYTHVDKHTNRCIVAIAGIGRENNIPRNRRQGKTCLAAVFTIILKILLRMTAFAKCFFFQRLREFATCFFFFFQEF